MALVLGGAGGYSGVNSLPKKKGGSQVVYRIPFRTSPNKKSPRIDCILGLWTNGLGPDVKLCVVE